MLPPQPVEELRQQITDAFATIDRLSLGKATNSLRKISELCVEKRLTYQAVFFLNNDTVA